MAVGRLGGEAIFAGRDAVPGDRVRRIDSSADQIRALIEFDAHDAAGASTSLRAQGYRGARQKARITRRRGNADSDGVGNADRGASSSRDGAQAICRSGGNAVIAWHDVGPVEHIWRTGDRAEQAAAAIELDFGDAAIIIPCLSGQMHRGRPGLVGAGKWRSQGDRRRIVDDDCDVPREFANPFAIDRLRLKRIFSAGDIGPGIDIWFCAHAAEQGRTL